MADRVTIQDIADALGLSRNTVSKAINNTGILAEATKERVLLKAMEMGYKTFSYAGVQSGNRPSGVLSLYKPVDADDPKKEVALITGMFLDASHFSSTMLDKLQYELSLLGYSMTLHRVMQEDYEQLQMPSTFHQKHTAAIICVEVFNYAYCQMICGLGLPVLLVDAPVSTFTSPLPADILLMDNTSGIYQIIKTAKQKGITKIGFTGQPLHCRSFFERFMAFREAMFLYSLPIDERFCITDICQHGMEYRDHLRDHVRKMECLPELFICANDFVAIDMMVVLRERDISCPNDVMLTGFDDSPESTIVTPPLTTCHIHSQIMGWSAVQIIMGRIRQPNLNCRTIHAETDLIYRESTRGEFENAQYA